MVIIDDENNVVFLYQLPVLYVNDYAMVQEYEFAEHLINLFLL